jgi:hypothetical protein
LTQRGAEQVDDAGVVRDMILHPRESYRPVRLAVPLVARVFIDAARLT